jgi:hypothetical protein
MYLAALRTCVEKNKKKCQIYVLIVLNKWSIWRLTVESKLIFSWSTYISKIFVKIFLPIPARCTCRWRIQPQLPVVQRDPVRRRASGSCRANFRQTEKKTRRITHTECNKTQQVCQSSKRLRPNWIKKIQTSTKQILIFKNYLTEVLLTLS